MKYLFAVNPVSGKGKAKQKMNELAILLKENKLNFIIFETQPYHYANDLKNIIIQNDITHVFAVGGDGTAHEVLNAIVDLDVYFGIIPFGTGNDFARLLNLPKKNEEVYEMIKRNEVSLIDIGEVNGIHFLNFVSFGIDVTILKNSIKYKRFFPSATAYAFSVFTTLLTYKCKSLKYMNQSEKLYLSTIHNGKFYGGGMKINPYAEVNDGLLDMCLVKKIPKLKLLFLFPSVFKGMHTKYDKIVSFKRDTNFIIETDEKIMTGIDGELYTLQSPIKINVVNKKIKFIKC